MNPAVHINTSCSLLALHGFCQKAGFFMIVRFICALFLMLHFTTACLWVGLHLGHSTGEVMTDFYCFQGALDASGHMCMYHMHMCAFGPKYKMG